MKWLTYDAVANGNYRGTEFNIDESTLDYKRYKEPISGLRVYEDGRIFLNKNGYRNPQWRSGMKQLTGLQFRRPDQFPNAVFTTHEGERVQKGEVDDIMMYDPDLERVYRVNWSEGVTFLHPNAQPVNKATIAVHKRNPQREKEANKLLAEYIAFGITLRTMDPDTYHWINYNSNDLREVVQGKRVINMQDNLGRHFCAAMARHKYNVFKSLPRVCADTHQHNYLLVKEK
jgi:hypothetical protein